MVLLHLRLVEGEEMRKQESGSWSPEDRYKSLRSPRLTGKGTGKDVAKFRNHYLIRVFVVLFEILHCFSQVHLPHNRDHLFLTLFAPLLSLGIAGRQSRL